LEAIAVFTRQVNPESFMKNTLHYLFVLLAFILTASALPAWAQPSMSAEYKQAAQAYYAAAAKETDPASASCDKAWGDYYTCVANSLVSGANVNCTAPTCQPGSGQGSAATTYSVNGQPTSQGTFQQGVDNSLNGIAAAIASPKTRNLGIAQGAFDIAGFFAKKAMEIDAENTSALQTEMQQTNTINEMMSEGEVKMVKNMENTLLTNIQTSVERLQGFFVWRCVWQRFSSVIGKPEFH